MRPSSFPNGREKTDEAKRDGAQVHAAFWPCSRSPLSPQWLKCPATLQLTPRQTLSAPTCAVSGGTDARRRVSPLSPCAFTPQVCPRQRPVETKARKGQEVQTNSQREEKKIKSLPSWLHCVRGRGGEQGDTISHSAGKGSEGSHGSTQHSPMRPRVVLLVAQVHGHTSHPYASAGPKAQKGCAESCEHMSYAGSPRSAASPPVGWQGSQVSLTQMSQPPALASRPAPTARHFMLKTIHSLLLGHNTPLR